MIQEFRHVPVVCDAPCTLSLFSLSSLWVLWGSGEERSGGWRLAGQANIPCGQRTDGTRLPSHSATPGLLGPAPVTVWNWCLLQRQQSPRAKEVLESCGQKQPKWTSSKED